MLVNGFQSFTSSFFNSNIYFLFFWNSMLDAVDIKINKARYLLSKMSKKKKQSQEQETKIQRKKVFKKRDFRAVIRRDRSGETQFYIPIKFRNFASTNVRCSLLQDLKASLANCTFSVKASPKHRFVVWVYVYVCVSVCL